MNEKIRRKQRKRRRKMKQQSSFDVISIQEEINKLQANVYSTIQKKSVKDSMDSTNIKQPIQESLSLKNETDQQIHPILIDSQIISNFQGGDALEKK